MPPAFLRRLLAGALPPADRDWLLVELDDLYAERLETRGRAAANRWYLRQVLSFRTRLGFRRLADLGPALTNPSNLRDALSMSTLLSDLRYAFRRIARTPGFTVVAVLSLALGIGANSAMFSVVNAVLLKGQPYTDPDRLIEVYTAEEDGFAYSTTSFPDLMDLRAAGGPFEAVVGTRTFLGRAEHGDRPSMAFGELVSWDYFRTLGVPMALGRDFLPEEDQTPGANPVVILGHRLWSSDFGADPDVVGQTVRLNGYTFEIVGVLDEDFAGSIPVVSVGYFAPLMMTDELMGAVGTSQLARRGARSHFVKARLAEGATVEQANAFLDAFSRRLAEEHPETNELRYMSAIPAGDVSLHPAVDRVLVPVAALLLGVVAIVLLIACVNLASFLLARAEDRRKEIAVRLALGSGRPRLVRQLLVETVILSSLGGAAGILLARWTLDLVLSFQPPLPLPVDLVVALDGSVVLFTAVISVLAGLAFGLVPALQATNPDVAPTLKDETGTGTRGRWTLRSGLVVTQVAFSFLLLIGAGLFIRSLQKAQRIDPGFYDGPAALIWPMPELAGHSGAEAQAAYYDEVEARLLADPIIDQVAITDRIPLGAGIQTNSYVVPDVPSEIPDGSWDIDHANVRVGYFEAMEVPILRGRAFLESDRGGDEVVVVSQAFVDRFYPGQDVLARTISMPGGGPKRIVGVAADTKVRTLGEDPRAYVYELPNRALGLSMQVVVRGSGSGPELLAAARRIMDEVDSDMVYFEAKTMQEHLALMLFPPRMAAFVLGAFGMLALILSAIGIYGVVSYAVSKRTRELGIRISLGATARDVIGMAVGSGMRLVLAGGGVGVVLAGGLTWVVSDYLFGVSSTDVATFLAIPVLLCGVALVAALVPARRAARVDPIRALRSD